MNFSPEEIVPAMFAYLAHKAHNNAKAKGFWEDEDFLIQIVSDVHKVGHIADSDLENYSKRIISLFNSEKVALFHSEISELLESLRKGPSDMTGGSTGFEDVWSKDEHCPDFKSIEVEIADTIIRLLDFAGRRDLRIGEALLAKMKYNESRSRKHGKSF